MRMKGKIFPSENINMASGDTPEICYTCTSEQYQGAKQRNLTTKKARLIDFYELQLRTKAWEAAVALREFEVNRELLFREKDRLRKIEESLQQWKIVAFNYELCASVLDVENA